MEINKITLGGFANLGDFSLSLSQITYLLSKNNVGKSNVMKAIDLAFLFLNEGKCSVDSREYSYDRYAPCLDAGFHRPFHFEIDGSFGEEAPSFDFNYSFDFVWNEEKTPAHFSKESFLLKKHDDPKMTTIFSRNGVEVNYQKKLDTHSILKSQVDPDTLFLYKLTFLDGIEFVGLVKDLRSVCLSIDSGMEGSLLFGMNYAIPHSSFVAMPNLSATPSLLYTFKKNRPNSFEKISNAMQSLFPSLEELIPQRVGPDNPKSSSDKDTPANYFLYIREKGAGALLSLVNMSDGFRRILTALIFLEESNDGSTRILCLEEPENGINPSLLRNYLTALASFAGSNKVIISSHSPFLASYIDPSSIYLGTQENSGITSFSTFQARGANRLMKEAADNDFTFGEYIYNLLAGDASDMETLKKALAK